jgi:hypothetical protein
MVNGRDADGGSSTDRKVEVGRSKIKPMRSVMGNKG